MKRGYKMVKHGKVTGAGDKFAALGVHRVCPALGEGGGTHRHPALVAVARVSRRSQIFRSLLREGDEYKNSFFRETFSLTAMAIYINM